MSVLPKDIQIGELPCTIDADALSLIRVLTDVNERLRVVADMSDATLNDALRIVNEFADNRVKRAKADTVRKMQEEIKSRCIEKGIFPVVVKNTIDKVAEELLKGE